MNDETIHTALVELAKVQAETAKVIKEHDTVLRFAKLAIAKAEGELSAKTAEVKDLIMKYIQETGDLTPHEDVTFIRRKKTVYDEDAALTYAQVNRPDLLKVALNKDAFNKAMKANELIGFDYEEVNAPTLAIGKLGHLIKDDE